jgi:WD40 repeat protein
MNKSILFGIACLSVLTPSLYSDPVTQPQKLTLAHAIQEALSNNKLLQELIAEKELCSKRIEEVKQPLIDTYKWPLIDLFKDYSVKRLKGGSLISFSSDGNKLLTGSSSDFWIWDLTKQPPTSIEPRSVSGLMRSLTESKQYHTDFIHSLAISKDGTKALTGSYDKTARLWDTKTAKLLATLQHDRPVTKVEFSPDGKTAFTGSGGTFRLWDITKEEPTSIVLLRTHGVNRVTEAAFSPDGKQLLTASSNSTFHVQLWNISKEQAFPTSITLQGHTEPVFSVAFSSDGKKALTGSLDKTARLWDLTKEQPTSIVLQGHTGTITSVAFSPDGKKALTGSRDKTARVWDITTEQPTSIVLQGHTGPVTSAVFSPDGTKVQQGHIYHQC